MHNYKNREDMRKFVPISRTRLRLGVPRFWNRDTLES